MGNSAKVAMKIDMDDEAMNPMHEEIERLARAAEIERLARAVAIKRIEQLELERVAHLHAYSVYLEYLRNNEMERAEHIHAWSVYLEYLLNEKIAQRERTSIAAGVGLEARNG